MEEKMKKLLKSVVKTKMFVIIAVIILAVFLISLLYYYWTVFVDGSFNEDDWGSTTYVASKYTGQAKITGNGIETETTAQELWDQMIKEGNNIEDYLDSPEELEKLMNAELITQYPKIGNGNIDGIIEFERHQIDDSGKDNGSKLRYIDKQTFEDYKNSQDRNILDYFTIDESGNVVVAIINERTYELSGNDDEMTLASLNEEGIDTNPLDEESKTDQDNTYYKKEIEIISKTINYKSIVEKYTMPFQYLWSLLVIGEDKDFVLELADLVYDSEIVFSIYDNINTQEDEIIYTYKKETRTDKYAKISVEDDYDVTGYETERYWLSEDSPEEYKEYYDSNYKTDEYEVSEEEYQVNYNKTYIINNPLCELTKADVWIVDYSKAFTTTTTDNTTSDENEDGNLEDTEYIYNEETSKNSNDDSSLLDDEDAVSFAESVKTYIETYLDRIASNDNKLTISSRAIIPIDFKPIVKDEETSSDGLNKNLVQNDITSDDTTEDSTSQDEDRDVVVNVDYVEYRDYDRKVERRLKSTINTVQKNYVAGDMVLEEKIDKEINVPNFVSILSDPSHSTAKDYITGDYTGWLFLILENNPDTVNMIDLTKRLLNEVLEKDTYKTDFDFSVYSENEFSTVSGTSGSELLIKYIHYWEHSTPPPTNADGTKYIIEDDGYGHPTVGYGVDIYNSGYLSLFQVAGYPTSIGGEVDKEFVDAIEYMILENMISKVTAEVSGLNLTQYQINALISRAFNCGASGALGERNGKTFIEAYNDYWNQESDNQFEEKNSNANLNHNLYTQYMQKPNTSSGQVSNGLIRRRKSEWVLFQTGYYDVLDEWHSDTGTIVETAKMIHEYMEQELYSYCVYGGNRNEECSKFGKSHGLNATFEQSKTGNKNACCATFVSWVLQETGYLSDAEHTDSANGLQDLLKSKGFITINNESELQSGDILCYDHHVEIYAGDNTIYNAGSGNAIRNASPQTRSRLFGYALRAPN